MNRSSIDPSTEDHLLPPLEIALLEAWINTGARWPEDRRTDQTSEKP